ncbi:hypothetical protein HU200_016083 [Digitaria exilis]|uniref:Uncharacterized protein n=1 Tax=Digitaria exilis TaxID=1010633 RepID=A0A835KLK5_9POAL|nr:hypothetical protein HU200_016083 [Digitaria exilis]
MAEILATMVVGPLLSMVKDKASSYLLDQYKVMEGMEEQHEVLKRKLPAILDVVADAEEQAAKHREGAKSWLEAVRKVAYKANDVLDEFKYEALCRKAKADGHYKAALDIRFVFRHRMSNKLRMILQEIDVLITEMNSFRFKFKPQPPMPMQWRQTDASTPMDCVDIAIKSRAQEKKDLVHRLLTQAGCDHLMVLPIVGMGGLGKTTLAQLIYNEPEIQKHFELRLWVCVSDDFDVDSLADKIVKENGCGSSESSALDKLHNAVSGKRYLLVLDDVWNRDEHKWEKLKACLRHGGSGSSVLTTTRDESVARLMTGKRTTDVQNLKTLDEVYIKEIIGTRAFGSKQEDKWPCELAVMVGDMVKRCSGSPLAATALGSVLRTKTRKQEWKDVLSRSMICDEENGILPVLKLSYNGLPSHMRQCFAFCAVFPKDYEINVEKMIQLWMANGFIPEKQGQHSEIIGKNIFLELASRSFFQDVKEIPFLSRTTVSRITCKIHDLMHDVAVDSMGNECATIATKLNKNEEFPYSARHLFLSVNKAETILNASLEKGSPALQTLICDRNLEVNMKILSKYNSIRALMIHGGSFLLRPKYHHHLRYLDLSESDIEELPEDISILYHLQTLNLSYCDSLERLPKELKYLTALRHLYTHACKKLRSMPAGLKHLSSLQTLTCFVAGTDSGCSNVGELQKLDLGGRLKLSQLENVTGEDAQAGSLGNKDKLTELTLRWNRTDLQDAQNNNHEEVVENLKPHDGLTVLRICKCGSSTFPKWLNTLRGMVELVLYDCEKLEKLPTLWQLPALQILRLAGLRSLHCLCSDGKTAITFPELKVLTLYNMPKYEGTEGEEVTFPWLEELSIWSCRSLKALPKGSLLVKQSIGRAETLCSPAFPALRKLMLYDLLALEKLVAVEGTQGEEVTFPLLEELSIVSCRRLSALPKGPLVKQSFVHETVRRRSAFPSLRKLDLSSLSALKRWGAVEGIPGEELEVLTIWNCPMLTELPEAPKLIVLAIKGRSGQQISLQAAGRYIPSLSSLTLDVSPDDTERTLLHAKQKWNHQLPMADMKLFRCNIWFSSDSSALALWTCFAQIVDLSISGCNVLVYWPENVIQALVSLRKLEISRCSKLTGRTQTSDEQSAPALERGALRPRLESLLIDACASLVEVPSLPVSLKTLDIDSCESLKSIIFSQQEAPRAVPNLSSTAHHSFLPCLESLTVRSCDGLSEVANLPPSINTLEIYECGNLLSLSGLLDALQELTIDSCSRLESLGSCLGKLRSLEELNLFYCKNLVSLLDRPQTYSSLRVLRIKYCDGIKLLPPSLQSRLDDLEEKDLDAYLEGNLQFINFF